MPDDKTRDHLANERTFLAWVRTSLGLIGLGFVVSRMGVFLRQVGDGLSGTGRDRGLGGSHVEAEFLAAGLVFLAIGTGLAGASAFFHDRNRRAIEAGTYAPSRAVAFSLSAVVVIGALVVAGLVVWQIPFR